MLRDHPWWNQTRALQHHQLLYLGGCLFSVLLAVQCCTGVICNTASTHRQQDGSLIHGHGGSRVSATSPQKGNTCCIWWWIFKDWCAEFAGKYHCDLKMRRRGVYEFRTTQTTVHVEETGGGKLELAKAKQHRTGSTFSTAAAVSEDVRNCGAANALNRHPHTHPYTGEANCGSCWRYHRHLQLHPKH